MPAALVFQLLCQQSNRCQ